MGFCFSRSDSFTMLKVKSLSRVRLFVTLWTVAHQAPPPMGFSRQEYWSGLPFPSPGDLPDPGMPGSQVATVLGRIGLPWWCRGQSVCLQYGRTGFNPWVGKIPWRRKWQPTPVFLPGESHGWRSLVGCSPRVAESRTRLSDFTSLT